jgi:hypothetical protein
VVSAVPELTHSLCKAAALLLALALVSTTVAACVHVIECLVHTTTWHAIPCGFEASHHACVTRKHWPARVPQPLPAGSWLQQDAAGSTIARLAGEGLPGRQRPAHVDHAACDITAVGAAAG